MEAGISVCDQREQSLGPHPGHLECGLLDSVLRDEGHPVSVLGCLVSLSGCMVSVMQETATKLFSEQSMSNTGGQHLPWVLREEAGSWGWVGSPGTHRSAKGERAWTHYIRVVLVLPEGSAQLCSASMCTCTDCLKCRPSLPNDGRLLPLDLALVSKGLGIRVYL